MKRYTRAAFAIMFTGGLAGVAIHFITKDKQRKAKNKGKHIPYGPYEAVIKRLLDIVFSGVALVVLSPIMGIVGGIVRRKLGSPILFLQDRPGLHGNIFKIFKYRTMTDERDSNGELLSDELRLTKFGEMLRSTSLDELPELFNILKGDMSIVGPRPLLVEYLPRYNERQRQRHDVRPGLTGLAQVNGRNNLSWKDKFEDDVKYVEKITFLGDMRIIIDTIRVVLKKDGINSPTSVTMETFIGNDE